MAAKRINMLNSVPLKLSIDLCLDQLQNFNHMSSIDKPKGEKYWKVTFYLGGRRSKRSLRVESHGR